MTLCCVVTMVRHTSVSLCRKRWGWNQTYGGDRSSRIIRAPEHQAAMAHAAGVMAAFARHLNKSQSEVAKWREVIDRHVNLTASLYRHEHNWFCDYNSAAGVWQSGCNDEGPATGTAGAGKQTYQLAPLFFHAPALGVDLLQGIPITAIAQMVDAVSNPAKFGSDPPGSLTFAEHCQDSLSNPRCVTNIWAPHPFITISSAGNVNHTAQASHTTKRLLDRVFGKMDARSRTHFDVGHGAFGSTTSPSSPYPGVSYECLTINYTNATNGLQVPAMEQSCGAEDYAWTAEATTVQLIREVIGFREHPATMTAAAAAAGESHSVEPTFILRPALPQPLVQGQVYTTRGLTFFGTRFDVHYEIAAEVEEGWLTVRVEESAAASSRTSNRVGEPAIDPKNIGGGGLVSSRKRNPAVMTMRNLVDQVHISVSRDSFVAALQ